MIQFKMCFYVSMSITAEINVIMPVTMVTVLCCILCSINHIAIVYIFKDITNHFLMYLFIFLNLKTYVNISYFVL